MPSCREAREPRGGEDADKLSTSGVVPPTGLNPDKAPEQEVGNFEQQRGKWRR